MRCVKGTYEKSIGSMCMGGGELDRAVSACGQECVGGDL